MRCVASAFVLAACATAPELDPRLGKAADVVVRAMDVAVSADVPEPPRMYCLSGGGWTDVCLGTIVAVRDGAFAARFYRTGAWIPADALHYLVPVEDQRNATMKGDGVVTQRIDDILVCRYFPRGPVRLQLGDSVSIDSLTTDAMRRGWKEECERLLGRR